MRDMRRFVLAAVAVVGVAASIGSTAADQAGEVEVEQAAARILSIAGDAAYGEYLGGECVTCHRQSGDASGIPLIKGLPRKPSSGPWSNTSWVHAKRHHETDDGEAFRSGDRVTRGVFRRREHTLTT